MPVPGRAKIGADAQAATATRYEAARAGWTNDELDRMVRDYMQARPPAAPDDEIALAHEFLHLAFKHHPSGADESFIENMARQLLLFPADCAD